jgi:hypothetical protein
MQRTIAFITILLASTSILLVSTSLLIAQTTRQQAKTIPKVDLPRTPRNSLVQKLQNDPDELTDSERQEYLDILYDYHRVSTILEQQLIELGNPFNSRLEMPPFRGINQIDDTDLNLYNVLMIQINQANRLFRRVEDTDPIVPNIRIAEMEQNILNIAKRSDSVTLELKWEIVELNKKLRKTQFEKDQNDIYRELFARSEDAIYQLKTILKKYTIPVWGVSVAGATNIYKNQEKNRDNSLVLSPSVGLYINPTTIIGMPDIFDIWLDYSNYIDKIVTNSNPEISMEHNFKCVSTGLNLHIAVSRFIKHFDLFDFYIKGGAGWFWLLDGIPNKPNEFYYTNLWSGYAYRVELELVNLTTKFPIAVYCNYSWKIIERNLAYIENANANLNVDLNNKRFNSVNAGLKFFITTHTPIDRER